MKASKTQDEKIAKMSVASVFPHYITKIEKKGRTRQELFQVVEWLTGFNEPRLEEFLLTKPDFERFFTEARIHPNARLIKGSICGYKVEEIENQLTQKVRYLDKLVDELAKGRPIEKILRTE